MMRAKLALSVSMALLLPACGGGGASQPSNAPTPTPSGSVSDYTCPSSDGTSSVAHRSVSGADAAHHGLSRAPKIATASISRIAVVYNRSSLQRSASSFARNEQSAGATLATTFDYPLLGKTIHILSVAPSQALTAMTSLRAQAGVESVTAASARRYGMTANAYLVNNNYFPGFSGGNTPPFYEAAAVPGQWDMHAIRLEYAFGYSQAGETAPGGPFANALGSHSVKLAVIDTGQDTLHPDLAGNIVYQKCFITNAAGTAQSTSNFSTDPQGHGTNVTGIAGAVTNPSGSHPTDLGFAGAGGNIGIMAYRVFPTPDDDCDNPDSSDPVCGADTVDIASAIGDAVNNGASVISLSLGGDGCSTAGVDDDPTEGAAVANAIAHNVIVVAASGNSSTSTTSKQAPEAPACDTGVIAVGATGLDDGTPNGSSATGGNASPAGTAATPQEYVAAYSNGSGASLNSSSSWGIVAPGGDAYCPNPQACTDDDDLHWIENIWTSTPFMANSTDETFEGECTDDYPNSTATTAPVDCRMLIEGTSQATPHVSGVAALVLSVSGSTYANPTAMKTLLCETADDIHDANEGCGRLDAYAAVAKALNDPSPPAPFTQ